MTDDPIAHFLEVAAAHPRCFWLDGGGAREWSGARSMIGWLDDDAVSLTYDAARGEVTRHAGGAAEVVGDDPFAVLESELAAGTPDDQWFGYFGYAARPDLPAAAGGVLPDAVWMRASEIRFFTHPDAAGTAVGSSRSAPMASDPDDPPPAAYAEAFARVQEQLRAGNSYEVNLTYRLGRRLRPGPGGGVPPAARAQPRAVRRLPPARRARARGPGCSARRRSATPWWRPTGRSRPSRSRAPRRAVRRRPRTRTCGRGWPPTRSSAPRT